jgi:hypothetical protein
MSNRNEQSHKHINQSGVNLTILREPMLGTKFDAQTATSLDLYKTRGIYTRDQATHF